MNTLNKFDKQTSYLLSFLISFGNFLYDFI